MKNNTRKPLVSKGYIATTSLSIMGMIISKFPDKIPIPEAWAVPLFWFCAIVLGITILLWIKDAFQHKTVPERPQRAKGTQPSKGIYITEGASNVITDGNLIIGYDEGIVDEGTNNKHRNNTIIE